MANANTPFGLRLVGHRGSGDFNARVRPYLLPSTYATAMFVGDPVVKTGTANAARVEAPGIGRFNPGTISEINKATAGASNRTTGVIVGFAAAPDNLNLLHNPASSERIAFVCDDPNAIFEIQADGPVAAVAVGLNANYIFTVAGSTFNGRSGVQLDTSAPAVTATFQMKIVNVVNREDVDLTTNTKVHVQINVHTEASGQTLAGDGTLGV